MAFLCLLIHCRHLENHCPVFADEKSFMTFILTSTNFRDSSSSFYVLYQFLLMRPILDAGIRILPNLVDFYQWIHTQFPQYLTRKQTESTTVNNLLAVEVSDVGYSPEIRTERTEQFQRICGNQKCYIGIGTAVISCPTQNSQRSTKNALCLV